MARRNVRSTDVGVIRSTTQRTGLAVTHVGLQVPGCYVGELISLCAVAAELSLTSDADLFQFSVFTKQSSFLAFSGKRHRPGSYILSGDKARLTQYRFGSGFP